MTVKILVVDDEPDVELIIRQKFRKQMRDGQWEFHFAHNGQEALDNVRSVPDLDLMLTDINMPVMDGLALLRELSAMHTDLKSIVISAYGDMSNIRQAMNQGALDFLVKPIDLRDLESTVTKTLEVVKQLKRAQRLQSEKLEAEAASKAKSKFLADMSHELRTPLNAIILYSELVMEEAEEVGAGEVLPDLRKINTAGRHLLTLINDILDFSKIEAGKLQLHVEKFAAADVVQDVIDILRSMFEKRSNRLDVDVQGDLGTMESDQTRVRQSLFNVLSNACKFTEKGVVTLTAAREGDHVVFRVSDTGIGMSTEHLGNLFQPFSQASPATTSHYGGTGLGLAITRRCCQMLGGTISATSVLGEGSTFTIRLPCTARIGEEAGIQ